MTPRIAAAISDLKRAAHRLRFVAGVGDPNPMSVAAAEVCEALAQHYERGWAPTDPQPIDRAILRLAESALAMIPEQIRPNRAESAPSRSTQSPEAGAGTRLHEAKAKTK
ncbi:MAG: hypothetical protein KF761_05430 [Salinibacterium sp.]|nr:hypothetical protein [Salinibacterium sp.]